MNISMTLTPEQTAVYLRTLPAIRERCGKVFDLAKAGKLQFFDYHPEKEQDVAKFCVNIMKRDYQSDFTGIKPHSRWRHLDAQIGRINPLIETWAAQSANAPNKMEEARRLVDLFVVSVLLDAGAGNKWSYTEHTSGKKFDRSEGLAVASVHMLEAGFFSSMASQKYRVDADALEKITATSLGDGLQVSQANPIVALEGRANLLVSLGKALKANTQFFGSEGRPGNVLDFLLTESREEGGKRTVPVAALWAGLVDGLNSIWPARLKLGGISLGDVWVCPALDSQENPSQDGELNSSTLVPFHKLTMWLTYSLIEILQHVLEWKVEGMEDMTGLPEYRNGGLLVDLGVLTLKPGVLPLDPTSGLPHAAPSHPAVVEWRAMTVIELDRVADLIRKELDLSTAQLTLAQILEGATWKGGREIAKQLRPGTGGPPIEIDSDGTVF